MIVRCLLAPCHSGLALRASRLPIRFSSHLQPCLLRACNSGFGDLNPPSGLRLPIGTIGANLADMQPWSCLTSLRHVLFFADIVA